MERVPHHPGRKPQIYPARSQELRRWLEQQPALTLAELQERLQQQAGLTASLPSLWMVWMVLGKIGLRLKKKVTPCGTAGHGSQSATAPSLPGNRPHHPAEEADLSG